MGVEEVLLILSARNTTDAVLRTTATNLDRLADSGDRLATSEVRLAQIERDLAISENEMAIRTSALAEARIRLSQSSTAVLAAEQSIARANDSLNSTIERGIDIAARQQSVIDQIAAARQRSGTVLLQQQAAEARLSEAERQGTEITARKVAAMSAYESAITRVQALENRRISAATTVEQTTAAVPLARQRAVIAQQTAQLVSQREAPLLSGPAAAPVGSEARLTAERNISQAGLALQVAQENETKALEAAVAAARNLQQIEVEITSAVTQRTAALLKNNEAQDAFQAGSAELLSSQAAVSASLDRQAQQQIQLNNLVAQRRDLEREADLVATRQQTQAGALSLAEGRAANLRSLQPFAQQDVSRAELSVQTQEDRISTLNERRAATAAQVAEREAAPGLLRSQIVGGVAGLGVLAAGAGAIDAAKKAAEFDQALKNTIATTTQATDSFGGLRDGILSLVDGSNRFNASQLQTGLFPILTAPGFHDTATAIAALKTVSAQAQAAGPESIVPLARADIGIQQAFGLRPSQFNQVADVVTRGEQVSGAQPVDFAKAVGTFAASAKAAGVTMEEAIGAFANASHLNPRFRYDAQELNRLFVDINKNQGKVPLATEKALGIDQFFGPGGVERAGGFDKFLGILNEATKGKDQQALLAQLFPNVAALTAVRGLVGENFDRGQLSINQVRDSAGAVANERRIAQSGPIAQFQDIGAAFNKQVLGMGEALLVAAPQVKDFSLAVLAGTQSIGDVVGALGHAADTKDVGGLFDKLGAAIHGATLTLDQVDLNVNPFNGDAQRAAGAKIQADAAAAASGKFETSGKIDAAQEGRVVSTERSYAQAARIAQATTAPPGFRVIVEQSGGVSRVLLVPDNATTSAPPPPPPPSIDYSSRLVSNREGAQRAESTPFTIPPSNVSDRLVSNRLSVQRSVSIPFSDVVQGGIDRHNVRDDPRYNERGLESVTTLPIPVPPESFADLIGQASSRERNRQAAVLTSQRQAAALAISTKIAKDPLETDLRANLSAEFDTGQSDTQILKTRDAIIGVIRDQTGKGLAYNKDTAGAAIAGVLKQTSDYIFSRSNQGQVQEASEAAQTAQTNLTRAQRQGVVNPNQALGLVTDQEAAQIRQAQLTDLDPKTHKLDTARFTNDVQAIMESGAGLLEVLKDNYDSATAAVATQRASLSLTKAQDTGNVPAELAGIEASRQAAIAQARIDDKKAAPGKLDADIAGINYSAAKQVADVNKQVADNQITAAQIQLQAAQIGVGNARDQIHAADSIYSATIQADKSIQDPAKRALADKQAGVTRDSTDNAVAVSEANKRIQRLQDERQFDINNGLNLDSVNKRLDAERKRDATLLGTTQFGLANAAFADQQAAIPRPAPTFGPVFGDRGVTAAPGQATFRFGEFGGDTTQSEISLLRAQVTLLQEMIAVLRASKGSLDNVDAKIGHGQQGSVGTAISHRHPPPTHGRSRGPYAQAGI